MPENGGPDPAAEHADREHHAILASEPQRRQPPRATSHEHEGPKSPCRLASPGKDARGNEADRAHDRQHLDCRAPTRGVSSVRTITVAMASARSTDAVATSVARLPP